MKGLSRKINKFIENIEDGVIWLTRRTAKAVQNLFKGGKGKKGFHLRDAIFLVVATGFVLFGAGLLWFSSIQIPDLDSFDQRLMGQSTKIFDRTGTVLLYDMGQNMRRTEIPFEEISVNLKNATLAIEDSSFYSHGGIKVSSIIRAFIANTLSGENSQGGSTITQQVVKNSLLSREKTWTRKIKEAFLAIKLERTLEKNQILNLYLNETSYGGTVYGVEEAAQVFFGKSARDVTIAEAAYMAAIPQSPTYYSPFGRHREELNKRKDLVLEKLKENGFITEEEYQTAKAEEVTFKTQSSGGIKAPHFVMFIREYLSEIYEDDLATEGLKVTTTIDYTLQQKAEEIVKKYALENAEKYHATNAALVTIDSATGQILTMVGSRDYFDEEVDGQYNVATAKRQPGSSFKPFIYAAAFEKGYTPETIMFDVPTQFSTSCPLENLSSEAPCYAPQNYDGNFRGPMTLRNALAQSINVPAVGLLYLVGVNNAIDLATEMGISTLTDRSRFGLSLVLGGGEVTLLDMTSAYSVFSAEGVKHPSTGILKIEDKKGKVLEEFEEQSEEVLSPNTALTISNILSDNAARTPVFGARSSLYFPDRAVAAKTGTTNDYRDTWVVGYTPQVVVGAWMGNNDNSPIARQVAGYIVAPMWHAYMNELLATLPNEPFKQPAATSNEGLKPILKGVWQTEAGVHSILYYVNKNDPRGAAPTNPAADPQFSRWEYAVQNWAMGQGLGIPGVLTPPLVTGAGPSTLSVSFATPSDGSVISTGSPVTAALRTQSNYTVIKADYFLNNVFIGSTTNFPFSFNFTLSPNMGNIGLNILKATVTDQSGASQSATVSFTKQ
ncbi:MAG: PBP1A family penicillin-binding protein [Candidatus Paceibacterota bacterium]